MSNRLAFWIPALPRRVLSTNAPGWERNEHTISDAKTALGLQTETALIPEHSPLPFFDRCRVYVTAQIKVHARPKLEDCPRCLPDYLSSPWPGRKLTAKQGGGRAVPSCRCYRPTDPPNLGGDVTKPLTDRLRHVGVIKDDTYQYVDAVAYRIEPVAELADEGIAVVIEEIERPEVGPDA